MHDIALGHFAFITNLEVYQKPQQEHHISVPSFKLTEEKKHFSAVFPRAPYTNPQSTHAAPLQRTEERSP